MASAGSLIIGFNGFGLGKDWMRAVGLVLGLAAILALSRSSVVDRWLTTTAGRLLHRCTDIQERDLGGLL